MRKIISKNKNINTVDIRDLIDNNDLNNMYVFKENDTIYVLEKNHPNRVCYVGYYEIYRFTNLFNLFHKEKTIKYPNNSVSMSIQEALHNGQEVYELIDQDDLVKFITM